MDGSAGRRVTCARCLCARRGDPAGRGRAVPRWVGPGDVHVSSGVTPRPRGGPASPSAPRQSAQAERAAPSPAAQLTEASMGSAGRLGALLLLVFLLGLHHSSAFWIVNVVFPPSAKPRVPSNHTPPLIIGKCRGCSG